MLNKEAQDLPRAKASFNVSTKRLDLDRVVRQSDYYACQYYNNNTIYDLTIMDNFGVRQTLKRKKERTGKQVLQIVREYRISHLLENEIQNFFDEVAIDDGEVLNAIKEAVSSPEFFKSKGFGHEYHRNASTGFMFCVSFDIDQDQLARDLTVDCPELGITVSRKNRQVMPANPCYSHSNKGSYNPFRKIVGKTFSMKRILANSAAPLRERYWYFVGDTLNEVEYINNEKMAEGIYITDYVKRLDVDEVISRQVKNIKFDEAFNKNGFFISERDAMLAANLELSTREKEVSLKEREHVIRLEDLEAQRSINESKRELALAKHDSEMKIIVNSNNLEEHKHANTIQAFILDQQAMVGKTEFLRLTLAKDIVAHNNEVTLTDLQFRNEVLKLRAGGVKHEYTMRELDRTEQVNKLAVAGKLLVMEADMIHEGIDFRRRQYEDKTKNITLIGNTVNTALKLIGK